VLQSERKAIARLQVMRGFANANIHCTLNHPYLLMNRPKPMNRFVSDSRFGWKNNLDNLNGLFNF
jgi:hypothetical protein